MLFQVTEIEFDFDDEDIHTEEYNRLMDETIGQIWEVDDEDDLVEEITCATGWCIKSIDYRHVLS
jgi:adenine specific DNA methylase Mod